MSIYYNPPHPGLIPDIFTYSGANRNPDNSSGATYMSAFALQQVKYPTGGRTVLTYEPNDYDVQKSIVGPEEFPFVSVVTVQKTINVSTHGTTVDSIDLSHLHTLNAAGISSTNLTVLVTFIGNSTYLNSLHNGSAGNVYFKLQGHNINLTEDITNSSMTCSTVCTITVPLSIEAASSLIYTWTAYIDPSVSTNFNQIHVVLQYDETQTVFNNSTTLTTGGLRIKAITDYSDSNTVVKQRTYDYTSLEDRDNNGTPETYSSGRLMSAPSYIRYDHVLESGGFCVNLVLLGSSYTQLSSAITGNTIGYGQETEYTRDSASGQDIGKTVYTYFNSPDTAIVYNGFRLAGTFNMGNNLDGSLLSQTVFANAGSYYKKVAATFNNYHTTNRVVYFSPKYEYTGQSGDPSACIPNTSAAEQETLACFYPSLKSERVLLDSTTQVMYDQNDSTQAVTTVKKYFYDNPIHFQLTRSRKKTVRAIH